jgi:hypothetical protein
MSARLVLLLILAALIGALYLGLRSSGKFDRKPAGLGGDPRDTTDPIAKWEKTPYARRPLPGEDPGIEPEFQISLQVDPADGRNQLYMFITEANGLFVETMRIHFWYIHDQEEHRFDFFIDDYLPARDTLVYEVPINPAELLMAGVFEDLGVTAYADMGEASDWGAEVVWHGRVRLEDPEDKEAWPSKH